jgi:lipopolysaccharide transport system ATP-binding protein
VWALKDINLEIEQGDVVGIIGKNGAGKSTLLKILSRVTKPTTGSIQYNGRIASLLEVGTGFHPEMTGRENIYMNGAIMGMTRHEITSKLDEIIAFAGVERYIDTPVKRYSSGMTVRLGFSIAAHLEPDILVVDEVLAVGDAEFQKKAIGKMQDVSKGGGRTVLFVSHNMAAVKSLCKKAVLLENGNIKNVGEVNTVINHYINGNISGKLNKTGLEFESEANNAQISINSLSLEKVSRKEEPITVETELMFKIVFEAKREFNLLHNTLSLLNVEDNVIFSVVNKPMSIMPGKYEAICIIPSNLLNYGRYYIKFFFVENMLTPILILNRAIDFEVMDKPREIEYFGPWKGYVRPVLDFTLKQK